MKPICNFCKHQGIEASRVDCKKAEFKNNDYGCFKQGSVCVHDSSLQDIFEPKKEPLENMQQYADQIKRLEDKLAAERARGDGLEKKLLKIG